MLLMMCCVSIVNAQNDSAVKIDEIAYVNYEYQRSVIDILLIVLKNSPDTNGVIIIHGPDNDPIFPYRQKNIISDHIKLRSLKNWFDPGRIELIQGESKTEPTLELWKVPKNNGTNFNRLPWDHKLRDLKEPLLIQREIWTDDIGLGEYPPGLKFYSEFLLANKRLLGSIIIKDKTPSKYKKVKARITKELVKKYRIANER